jgi:hypothetical protein
MVEHVLGMNDYSEDLSAYLVPPECQPALIKKKRKFPKYKEIQKESVAKSYMTNGLLLYG